jgi:hypothetical protein
MKTAEREWEVFSLMALFVSAIVWWFIDGELYTACAFGGEYTLLFGVDDWSFPTTLLSAVGSSLLGLVFAIRAAFLKPKRKLYVVLLITLNLYVSPLGWLELQDTAATTEGPG